MSDRAAANPNKVRRVRARQKRRDETRMVNRARMAGELDQTAVKAVEEAVEHTALRDAEALAKRADRSQLAKRIAKERIALGAEEEDSSGDEALPKQAEAFGALLAGLAPVPAASVSARPSKRSREQPERRVEGAAPVVQGAPSTSDEVPVVAGVPDRFAEVFGEAGGAVDANAVRTRGNAQSSRKPAKLVKLCPSLLPLEEVGGVTAPSVWEGVIVSASEAVGDPLCGMTEFLGASVARPPDELLGTGGQVMDLTSSVRGAVAENWTRLNEVPLDTMSSLTSLKKKRKKVLTGGFMSALQQWMWSNLREYRDVASFCHTWAADGAVRSVVLLHLVDHVVKSRERVRRHNTALHLASVRARQERLGRVMSGGAAEHNATGGPLSLLEEKELAMAGPAESDDEHDEGAEHDEASSKRVKTSLATESDDASAYRDQGLTRPRVLVLTSTRFRALQLTRQMLQLLPGAEVSNMKRFLREFGDEDAPTPEAVGAAVATHEADWGHRAVRQCSTESIANALSPAPEAPPPLPPLEAGASAEAIAKREKKEMRRQKRHFVPPSDWRLTFNGNIQDDFRVGMQVGRKRVELYSEFYHSDVIVASPLGLRLAISKAAGEDGAKPGAADFLSSVEVLLLDSCGVLLQQNWEHVEALGELLNARPEVPRDTDMTRVRMRDLDGLGKHFRQTIVLSEWSDPDLASWLRMYTANARGWVALQGVHKGAISTVIPIVRQIFQRVPISSIAAAPDARLAFFDKVLLPRLRAAGGTSKHGIQPQTLIVAASYFEYVRLRNFMDREEVEFAPISEHSDDKDVARARALFAAGETPILLTTERWFYFHRSPVRGARHVVFYGVPRVDRIYSEVVNSLTSSGGSESLSCLCLFTKLEAAALERIVGTSRAPPLLQTASQGPAGAPPKTTFVFLNDS
jgi:hypothetical protein